VAGADTKYPIRLKNALQSERNVMRTTLVPALLRSLAENLRHEPSVRLAELSRVYLPQVNTVLADEVELVGMVAAGRIEPLGLSTPDDQIDFFELKGVIELVLQRLGVSDAGTHRWAHPAFHPGRSAEIRSREVVIARFGEIHPDVASAYGIDDQRVVAGEINLSLLVGLIEQRGRDAYVPRFLPVRQDFAVVVNDDVPAADVEAAFWAGGGPLLTDVTLFDQFRGPQIGEGKVSMAYRLTFTAPDRTLTDSDLVKIRPRIEKVLRQSVEGTLRV
jgi:phenylalanyl-tRNA synthetase beta chain